MQDNVALRDLLEAAVRRDELAWNALVSRYAALVKSVARSYRLNVRDAEDVNQTVWLRLVEHVGEIRTPEALPKWIVTTTRHESLRVIRARARMSLVDRVVDTADEAADTAETELLRAERDQAVRDGLAELEPKRRELLELLSTDPPISYRDISRRLGMPVGSIGPSRARSLARLGATQAIRAYLDPPSPGQRRPSATTEAAKTTAKAN